MKKIVLVTGIIALLSFVGFSQDELPAYYLITSEATSIDDMTQTVKNALESKSFNVIGEYAPEDSEYLKVIVYTRNDLRSICFGIKNRGALAAALKVGIFRKGDQVSVYLLNPEYLFYAYLQENVDDFPNLISISDDARAAMREINPQHEPFGGTLEVSKLLKYRYMAGMANFNKPVELKQFSTFIDGLKTIRANLESQVGNTLKVYEMVDEDLKVAVFGVGLLNVDKGEPKFLPIVGEEHLAAMPYELILMNNEASMLHGKFRIALHWPELTMGTFTKIMKTPGHIEDFMKALTE